MENIILKRRKELGMTQEKLSELSGIHKIALSRLENERRPLYNLRITTALKLADALGIDPHEFIKDAPEGEETK